MAHLGRFASVDQTLTALFHVGVLSGVLFTVSTSALIFVPKERSRGIYLGYCSSHCGKAAAAEDEMVLAVLRASCLLYESQPDMGDRLRYRTTAVMCCCRASCLKETHCLNGMQRTHVVSFFQFFSSKPPVCAGCTEEFAGDLSFGTSSQAQTGRNASEH